MLRSPIYAAKQEHEGKLYDAGWEPIRREHGDEPERLKSAVARFVDWHGGDKGEGQLEVSLFAHPVALSPEAVEYDSALRVAGRCFVQGGFMVGATGLEPVTSWV